MAWSAMAAMLRVGPFSFVTRIFIRPTVVQPVIHGSAEAIR